jgi:hypothetical protein
MNNQWLERTAKKKVLYVHKRYLYGKKYLKSEISVNNVYQIKTKILDIK